jgi:hypothetical protein
MIEAKFVKEYGDSKIQIHETEILEAEARLAFSLLERWGMVAACPDGEDSAGRSKLRLSETNELIDRAFDVARLAFDRARNTGLIYNCGPLPELDNEEK